MNPMAFLVVLERIHPHPDPLPEEEGEFSPSSTSSSHQGRRTEKKVLIGRGKSRNGASKEINEKSD